MRNDVESLKLKDFLPGANENQNWLHTKVEQKQLPAHHQHHCDLPLHFLNALVLAPNMCPQQVMWTFWSELVRPFGNLLLRSKDR